MGSFVLSVGANGGTRYASMPAAIAWGPRHVLHRGFIANRQELVARAGREHGGRATFDDSELFALAAGWWGHDLPRHVIGEYALAVLDRDRQELLLAHDELGLVPLFYALEAQNITVSTHLDDLVRETGVGTIDEAYVADWLVRAEHGGERTPYRHIRRLLPGQSATWRNGRWSAHDVWTLGSVPPLRLAEDEYADRLRQLTFDAVATALPPAGRVWCELSGGLDSSSVAMAATRLGASVETVSFDYSCSHMAGERRWIDTILAACPMPNHPLDVDAAPPFARVPTRFMAEPSAWVINDAFDAAYTDLLARHRVDVLLTGEGGDAVLCGDVQRPLFLADALRTADLGLLTRQLGRWGAAAENRRSAAYALFNYAMMPLWNTTRSRMLEHHSLAVPWLTDGFAKRMQVRHRQRRGWRPRADTVGAAYMLQRILRGAGLISTHTHHRKIATEFRNPLLYRPLVEFMLAVPWDIKLAPGKTRPLQRRALAGLLPTATLGRTDKGGSDQPWYRGLNLGTAVRLALTERPRAADRGWFDRDRWRTAVQHARFGVTIGLGQLRASAAVELWLQQLETIPAAGARSLAPELAVL